MLDGIKFLGEHIERVTHRLANSSDGHIGVLIRDACKKSVHKINFMTSWDFVILAGGQIHVSNVVSRFHGVLGAREPLVVIFEDHCHRGFLSAQTVGPVEGLSIFVPSRRAGCRRHGYRLLGVWIQ